jgi:putative ABC transport system substrate-binding protein
MLNRRRFLGTLSVSLLAAPVVVEAQQTATMRRIGLLFPTSLSDPRTARFVEAFRQGLRELGYAEGQNVVIESRFAEGDWNKVSGLVAELVRAKVEVIVTYTTPATQAARHSTTTIPIVVAAVIDPVAAGLVASLAHPGGNITGLSQMVPELVAKQLQVLKELAPKISRVALLGNPSNVGNAPQVRHAQDAARALGIRLQPLEARSPSEIESAFAAMTTERAGAMVVLIDSMLIDHRTRIAGLAARHRLPMVSGIREIAEAGGIMSYGPSVADMFRRAAAYVDKILKGAKPGDLPVEQPIMFELVINVRTAKALGLTIPRSLLLRADHVIE